MSRITEARSKLAMAISARYNAERTHEVTPNRVDAPCIFLGGASLDRDSIGTLGTPVAVVTFPVYIVADGRPDEQTRKLDELLAYVWDSAFDIGALPLDASPTAIDVGGPTLRGALVRVELTLAAVTLCTPTLEAVNG